MDEAWWKGMGDLDDKQKEVMALPLEGTYVVLGPPGSGKTNLLLLRANYAVLSGKQPIAVVVFNSTLQTFIVQGAKQYDFSSGHVVTSTQLFYRILRTEGIDHVTSVDFEENRKNYIDEMNEVVKKLKAPIYDSIFLDEAQDHTIEELDILKSLTANLFMVGDGRQRIYGSMSSLEQFLDKADDVVRLEHHYRNGRDICKLADGVGQRFTEGYEDIYATCNYDESQNVSKAEFVCGTLEHQLAKLLEKIEAQRKAFPSAMIGILSPTKASAEIWEKMLKDAGLADQLNVQIRGDNGYNSFDPNRKIWLSTIHSSKGLEFRAVHIISMDAISKNRQNQKRVAYTGITRAKTSLTIYHEQPLPAYLAGASTAVVAPPKKVTLESAFGKK